MGILSFSDLVEALARSVAKAQDQVERHQIKNLLNYFDDKFRPKTLEFKVPSRRSDAKPFEEDLYQVPLLALVSINVLKIKDIEIKFSVDMEMTDEPVGEMTEEPAAAPDSNAPVGAAPDASPDESDQHKKMAGFASPMKTLNVSTSTGRGGGKMRVSLRVTGSEPSEGAARLLDYLAQMQGVYPTPEGGERSIPEKEMGKE
jgi:hypothetical protein